MREPMRHHDHHAACDRRKFLGQVGLQAAGGIASGALAGSWTLPVSAQQPIRDRLPRVAFLGTVVKKHSHAQHFLDRHTAGYTWGGRWQKPRIEVASVYIDQFPEDDLARSRAARHGLKLYPTIEEALTCGGEK